MTTTPNTDVPANAETSAKAHPIKRLMSWFSESIFAIWTFIGDFFRDPMAQLQKLANWFEEWLKDPYRLRVYGESLLTEEVRQNHAVFTKILTCVYIFEFVAWCVLWLKTGMHPALALVLGWVFARIIVTLDRGILVMPTPRGFKAVGVVSGRILMLLMLSVVTSIPWELLVFTDEVEQVLLEEEAGRARELRKELVAEKLELAKVQAQAVADAGAGVTKVESDRRLEEKRLLMERQDRARAAIVARQAMIQKRLDREIAKASDRQDKGDITLYRRSLKAIDRELAAHDKRAQDEIDAFDKKSDEKDAAARMASTSAATEQGEKTKGEVAAVSAMSNDELAAEMRGTVTVARGLVAQVIALFKVTQASTLNMIIAWGIRGIMVIIGLSVLFTKFLMKSIALSAYYSITCQAAEGDEDAMRQIRSRATEGDDEAIKALCDVAPNGTVAENLGIVRTLALKSYPDAVEAVCLRTEGVTGAVIDDVQVVHTLAQRGVSRAIAAVCARAEGSGIAHDLELVRVLAMRQVPAAVQVVRTRARNTANQLDRDVVQALGFNPDEVLAFQDPCITKASVMLARANEHLHEALVVYREEMVTFCGQRPAPARRLVNMKARELWRKNVTPKMDARASAANVLRQLGGMVPPWSPRFTEKDPLLSDELRIWDENAVSYRKLISEYGWELPPLPVLRGIGSGGTGS